MKAARPQRIAYVVYDDWDEGRSGVFVFIRSLLSLFAEDGVDFKLVAIPYESRRAPALSPGRAGAFHRGPRIEGRTSGKAGRKRCRAGASVRLVLGYVHMLAANVWALYPRRRQMQGRLVLTNRFGCETLPIAIRLLHPFATIVAVAHTHPGQERDWHCVRNAVERLCYGVVSDVIYNSNSLREEWQHKLKKQRLKGHVIHHGLGEPSRDTPDDYPARSRQAGSVDFVCVARFVDWKGHNVLLEAWKRARAQCNRTMRLILVGDGPTLEESIQLSRDLGLDSLDLRLSPTGNREPGTDNRSRDSDVFFLGYREEGGRYFAPGDVGVLLSTEPEAFGFVLLEALSRGKPVVASRLGGIPEIVEHADSGLLVDPGRPDDVAAAICRLAQSASERVRMGQNARGRWRSCFTLDRMLAEYRQYLSRYK